MDKWILICYSSLEISMLEYTNIIKDINGCQMWYQAYICIYGGRHGYILDDANLSVMHRYIDPFLYVYQEYVEILV